MRQKILVLGCGLIGQAIVQDLAQENRYDIIVVDQSDRNLTRVADCPRTKARVQDLSLPDPLQNLARESDLVIGALPGWLGFRTVQALLNAGRPVVDISFFAENPFLLDDQAKANGLPVVVDCGLAPGLTHILFGMACDQDLDHTESFVCYVGGLPKKRTLPFEYQIVFSAKDVLEEYTRAPRIVQNGVVQAVEALSDLEEIEFDEIGTLEAFNTDGLRTLLHSRLAPNMTEKTLRYPGHAGKIEFLARCGFLDKEEIDVDGLKVTPIEVTSRLLFPLWKAAPGDADMTLLLAQIEGSCQGTKSRITYRILDHYDKSTDTTSMARTTGYTCTQVARLILTGHWTRTGIIGPEQIGLDREAAQRVLDGLAQRGILIQKGVEVLP